MVMWIASVLGRLCTRARGFERYAQQLATSSSTRIRSNPANRSRRDGGAFIARRWRWWDQSGVVVTSSEARSRSAASISAQEGARQTCNCIPPFKAPSVDPSLENSSRRIKSTFSN